MVVVNLSLRAEDFEETFVPVGAGNENFEGAFLNCHKGILSEISGNCKLYFNFLWSSRAFWIFSATAGISEKRPAR